MSYQNKEVKWQDLWGFYVIAFYLAHLILCKIEGFHP